MIDAMTAYIDAQGRRWDTAEEALADFISDLPAMTDEETENLFSATRHDWDAARNLQAIDYAATYHGLAGTVLGYYPIPQPEPEVTARLLASLHTPEMAEDRGWGWDSINDRFMVSHNIDWDLQHVPFFQQQRQAYNRRVLAQIGPPYETSRALAENLPSYAEYKERL